MHAYVSRADDTLSQRVPATWLCGMCFPSAWPRPPFGRGNLPISTAVPAFSAASISSSSVRRCNNLIPYSRGGCRPWRIEWNKIKPRIPRVLWRGSFPIQPQSRIPTSAACARVYVLWASASSFCSCSLILFSPVDLLSALHFCALHDFRLSMLT